MRSMSDSLLCVVSKCIVYYDISTTWLLSKALVEPSAGLILLPPLLDLLTITSPAIVQ
jgi:hypothetical protein